MNNLAQGFTREHRVRSRESGVLATGPLGHWATGPLGHWATGPLGPWDLALLALHATTTLAAPLQPNRWLNFKTGNKSELFCIEISVGY